MAEIFKETRITLVTGFISAMLMAIMLGASWRLESRIIQVEH